MSPVYILGAILALMLTVWGVLSHPHVPLAGPDFSELDESAEKTLEKLRKEEADAAATAAKVTSITEMVKRLK
jgi:hypothetical protein